MNTPESNKAKIAFTSLFANDDAYWIPYTVGIKLESERDEARKIAAELRDLVSWSESGPWAEYLGECLVRHNIVDAHALDDPEGYDGYQTLERIGEAYDEITQHLTARANDALQKVTDLMANIQSRKNETSPCAGATEMKS
jgi:hypothetical protein